MSLGVSFSAGAVVSGAAISGTDEVADARDGIDAQIKQVQTATSNVGLSDTIKLILQQQLRLDQIDKTTNTQLLQLAKGVERPFVYTHAASNKITARSRRNTVVIAALIGLILGALAALLWDTVVPRLAPRNGD